MSKFKKYAKPISIAFAAAAAIGGAFALAKTKLPRSGRFAH